MKIYIETDMERISGVLTFEQTGRDKKGVEYEKARHLLTQDVKFYEIRDKSFKSYTDRLRLRNEYFH